MEFQDYYATLGVAKNATDKDIKQAYRKLARKHHPDLNPGDKAAEMRFKAINEANEVLGDPDKRRKYDELGANWRLYEQAQQQGGPSPFGGGAWNVHFGSGVEAATRCPRTRCAGCSATRIRSRFLPLVLAVRPAARQAARARVATRSPRGRDVEQDLELSLEDAFHGATRRFSIKHDGHARSVDVRIPAGVGDGSRVRVAGEGEHGGAGAGDLYLRIHIQPHARFERRGRDLHTRITVPVTTVVLGGEAEVPALDGHALRLKIPASTQNGQVFRLRGHGMPAVGKSDDRGDLYATIDVAVPRSLTPEQRSLYEALARLRTARPRRLMGSDDVESIRRKRPRRPCWRRTPGRPVAPSAD